METFCLKRGMNIETPGRTLKSELVQEKYLGIIRDAGFDHVRLPVKGEHLESGGRPFWEELRGICETVLSVGMIPMLDMHGYFEINRDPLKHRDGYLKLWEELAAALADIDQRVVFELLNEPSGKYTFQLLNEFQNEAIARIRKTNPTRMLALATAHFNTIENLQFLNLPENDPNVFITVHDYTPMKFTHQGAPWNVAAYPETGIVWGTAEERRYLEARFDFAAAWAAVNKRYLHMGEFGVVRTADPEQRAIWTEFVVRLCEERGIGWCYWEFWENFYAYEKQNDQWNPALLKALMPGS